MRSRSKTLLYQQRSVSRPRRARRANPKAVLAVLLLASLTAMTVDYQGRADSPFDPAREVLADAVAPLQSASLRLAKPLKGMPSAARSNTQLRDEVARLQGENASLRGQLATTADVRTRAAQFDGLLGASAATGLAMVPARVIAYGPAQAFTDTVTIDAGRSSGVGPDMTVVSNAGLVGRVIEVSRSSATVLLITDSTSVVGGRLGSNAEIGFLRGRGEIGGDGRLDLDLLDNTLTPGKDDVVSTWGSKNGAPYLAGIPIGTIESVAASPRQQAKYAVIQPFVDFSSLDLVGVVVAKNTKGDRTMITEEVAAQAAAQ